MEKKKTLKNTVEDEISTFESALEGLEHIAVRLENGELGLEESIDEFEKGIRLAQYCHKKLEEAERKIEILQKRESGAVSKKAVKIKEDSGEIEDDDEMQGSLL